MKIKWCKRHGSNVGLGLDRCYYAHGRSFDYGDCAWDTLELVTPAELDAIELAAWERGRAWQDFDPSTPLNPKYAAQEIRLP